MSSYSVRSNASTKSRAPSTVFPSFPSSLAYTQVRDFAYPLAHPHHFGPPQEASAAASGQSTPALEYPSPGFPQTPTGLRTNWSDQQSSDGGGLQLAPTAYGADMAIEHDDHGPPYSEDEDLQSPVVMSSRHRKNYDEERGYFAGTNGDGSETYYVSDPNETADGPGGELVTYPAEQARQRQRQSAASGTGATYAHARHISHTLDSNTWAGSISPGATYSVRGRGEESRLSRDYSFTIASADEEMHGKAVALFDFAPENGNELPLVEGQVIWVSYRNGQGWLVAEDPKSRETGLVPEEYVRLLRHIEGGLTGLTGMGEMERVEEEAEAARSPLAPAGHARHASQPLLALGNGSTTAAAAAPGDVHPPVQSSFSTSSRDLDPYPHPLLSGGHAGQKPPLVDHHSSQGEVPQILPLKGAGGAPDGHEMLSPKALSVLERRKSSEGKRSASAKRKSAAGNKGR